MRPFERRSPADRVAAVAHTRLRDGVRALLTPYCLESALELDWLDGRWSDIWPLIRRMSDLKERDAQFLEAVQHLRDTALDEIESIAVAATRAASKPSVEHRR